MFFIYNSGNDPQDSHGNPVIGGALSLYDLIGAVSYTFVDPLQRRLIIPASLKLPEMLQIDPGNIGAAPNRQFAVPVFSNNKSVNAFGVHLQLFPQKLL